MIPIIKYKKRRLLALATAITVLASCNKGLEQFPDIAITPLAGKGLAATIAANPTDSLYYKLIVKAGMVATLDNLAGGNYTMLVPDNDAMIASGLSNSAVTALPLASAIGIVSYNIIPQKVTTAMITTAFPNMQLPTMIKLDPTNSLVRMTTFLSKNGNTFYINNIPLGVVDVQAANGVIHKPLRVVAPPSTTLKGAMAAEADLSLFRAAVARGDSGQINLNRFDSLFNYGVTNMTVLAPNNNAFKSLVNALSGGAVPPGAPDAVFINFINTMIPAAQMRGILAYHLAASINPAKGVYEPNSRVFSTNTSGATFLKTMVNSSVAAHPGILAQATYTGPFATALKFTQAAPLTAPFTTPAANAVAMDKHAVNGVYHIIDRVLMPQ